ncbi:MAG: hypothetical protein JJD92_01480 [Frankiaceae bacterium]|nr:hypothetical protein [Frankiaceae bacterium]
MTVVADTPDCLWLWMPAGCVRKVPDGAPVDPTYPQSRKDRIVADLLRGNWEHQDHVWEGSTLVVVRPGDWYATWCSWHPDGRHWGWPFDGSFAANVPTERWPMPVLPDDWHVPR